ncbi:hydrolase [Malaciobacter molluscorum LMG 25693]|uniref:phosphoglycolate phosphatase n=1 Tax=Malaciobacter molluscorum LMG 25693 TaxID=870501 RepID=A0A2G1DF74_9BACT|nr:HAD family hydrolase [Malaciobacter molluscorum]AXX91219.1 HAD superfamily hydrolase, probable phosphatase [Malaciobacter molluscorum LMG 25693]PHO17104.1 hydrolase [Malaciobacter molluscorum LMG 25693]RXJ92159.1 hydrolase [Malaciobacter molluscorum]
MKENNILLFDLDGTLIDSTEAIITSFKHTFEQLAFDFKGKDDDIKNLIGYPLDIMYKDLGVEEERVWDFVDAYKQKYKDISKEKTLLLENVKETLQIASSFARLSIVTTKTAKYTKPLLEHLEILNYFEFITGREDVENPKPHPEPILKTLELMKYDETKQKVWMIGDTKLDLICANNAGVNCVGVLCGYANEDSLKEYSGFIVQDSLDAVNLIKNITNPCL